MTHEEYIKKAIKRLAEHPWYENASESDLRKMAEYEWKHWSEYKK